MVKAEDTFSSGADADYSQWNIFMAYQQLETKMAKHICCFFRICLLFQIHNLKICSRKDQIHGKTHWDDSLTQKFWWMYTGIFQDISQTFRV